MRPVEFDLTVRSENDLKIRFFRGIPFRALGPFCPAIPYCGDPSIPGLIGYRPRQARNKGLTRCIIHSFIIYE